MLAGMAGAAVALVRLRRSRGRSLLPLALAVSALLPLSAFHAGHPERVRYMVAVAVAAAALSGLAIGAVPKQVRAAIALAFLGACVWLRPPLSAAPMVTEAQWELPFREGRRVVTAVLQEQYDGLPILASMNSLAHYMQDVLPMGLPLRAFLHEGNGDLWAGAFKTPRPYVGWILIEEQARDGDLLARRARADPAFLDGFTRVAAGGGLVLYRRQAS